MQNAQKAPNHYPNPWLGRGILIALIALLLMTLTWAVLRPDVDGRQAQASENIMAEMDAAERQAPPALIPPTMP